MARPRPDLTADVRAEAVRRIASKESTFAQEAERLKVTDTTLRKWARDGGPSSSPKETPGVGGAPRRSAGGGYEAAAAAAKGASSGVGGSSSPNAPPPPPVPSPEAVVAWCQGAVMGLGSLLLGALKIPPSEETVKVLTFTKDEAEGLKMPAAAAAPDIAALMGETRYVGLAMLGLCLVGVTARRAPEIARLAREAAERRAFESARPVVDAQEVKPDDPKTAEPVAA